MRTSARFGLWMALAALTGCASEPREGVEEKFNFWPLAAYETSERPEGYTLDLLWPLLNWHRAGEASASRVLPFYVKEDDGRGTRFLNALVLYWQTIDELAGSSRRTLFPFFISVRSEHEWKTHVWPLYGLRKYWRGDEKWRDDSVLFPVFDYDRSLATRAHDLAIVGLGSLFTLFRSRASEIGAGPEAERWREEIEVVRVLDELFRLVQYEERPESQEGDGAREQVSSFLRLLDMPGLYQRKLLHAPDGTLLRGWTHLFPLYFHRRQGADRSLFLLPLFGRQTGEEGYRRNWFLPPLLSLEDDPANALEGLDVLWPLWRYERREGEDPGHHLRMLPLLWFTKRPDSKVSLVLPFYYHIQDEENEYLHLIPLYGRHLENGGRLRRTFIVPPLYVGTTDSRHDLSRTDLLYPLMRFERSRDGNRNYVFPLFYYRGRENRSHLNVLGLFDRDLSEVRRQTLFYPFYSDQMAFGEGSRRSFLPLLDWRYATDPIPRGRTSSFLFPLSNFFENEDGIGRWIFPFYWWFDDEINRSFKMIWPFFGVEREADGLVRTSTLFPLFFRGSTPDGERKDSGILFPLGGTKRTPERRVAWFFPLFYDRVRNEGQQTESSRSWVLWPLFSSQWKPDGSGLWHSLFHLLRFERAAADAGEPGAEEFAVLGALYRSRETERRITRSVAFLFNYEHEAGQSTLRLFHLIPIRW